MNGCEQLKLQLLYVDHGLSISGKELWIIEQYTFQIVFKEFRFIFSLYPKCLIWDFFYSVLCVLLSSIFMFLVALSTWCGIEASNPAWPRLTLFSPGAPPLSGASYRLYLRPWPHYHASLPGLIPRLHSSFSLLASQYLTPAIRSFLMIHLFCVLNISWLLFLPIISTI